MGMVALGVVPLGMAGAKSGMAALTTAAGVTAVAEAEEACLGLAVARDADKGEALDEEIGVVAAALGEETVDGGTAREAVPTNTARRSPSARLRARARTTARSRWCRARGKRLPPWWTFHPPPCARVNCE